MLDDAGVDMSGGTEEPSPGGAAPSDGFVVVVADPVTGDIDAFGPYPEPNARDEAIRRRHELDAEELTEVLVVVVALTPPP